ncbi:YbaB/EbfC family nucleoid-associated protein [Flavicella marina]|uniref:YbaB/EbfC family nucleoid-associated protein n=1 Tax=Flavicella marina TaxID=1475951 RepID=UPI0012656476|nr:YbaB/EbfC family nucleoid-associated protein [Flavicella marina]
MEKNAKEILSELEKTQAKIVSKKEHLRTVFIDGESGNGLVVATITGNKKVVNIAIDDSVLNNRSVLEEHLITALNDALDKASDIREKEISNIKKEEFPYVLNF